MKKVSPIRIKFYEFLNGDIKAKELEKWIYETVELEKEFPEDHYIDLISYSYNSVELDLYIRKLVKIFFDYEEYERWRTIKLLKSIENKKIEIVLATRKLRKLFLEQKESIIKPLISINLGIGFESLLDECPTENEYEFWNSESLKKQLEIIKFYKDEFETKVKKELHQLQID